MKKTFLAAALALCCLGTSSCLGANRLFNSVNNWNAKLSSQDWVNEVVYLGLWFIPVYPIALFGDAVLFNTVEYWSGDAWINDPGQFPGFTRKDNEKK